jgi:hypothetical protein
MAIKGEKQEKLEKNENILIFRKLLEEAGLLATDNYSSVQKPSRLGKLQLEESV